MMRKLLIALLAFPLEALAQPADSDFVKGADVGFLTGQERRGVVFHDRNGQERECLELLKNDYQMSAIRMRVWVNRHNVTSSYNARRATRKPSDGWYSNISDSCSLWR